MKKILIFSLLIIVAITATSIQVSASSTMTFSDEDVVEELRITTYESEMYIGDTQEIEVNVLNGNMVSEYLELQSSDVNVAEITSEGEITAISSGTTVITATYKELKQEFVLTVKVPTQKIEVKDRFISIFVNDIYQLEPIIHPATAEKKLEYTYDSNHLIVNEKGEITALKSGVTYIIVKNDKCRITLTVAVNEKSVTEVEKHPEHIPVDNFVLQDIYYGIDIITSQMLKTAYETGTSFKVVCTDYDIIIYGDRIVNYSNEMVTTLQLYNSGATVEFVVNGNMELPGEIGIHFHDAYLRSYLYLYNSSKEKFELLKKDENIELIHIKSPGKYVLTDKKLDQVNLNFVGIAILGTIIITSFVVILLIKKKHWFW